MQDLHLYLWRTWSSKLERFREMLLNKRANVTQLMSLSSSVAHSDTSGNLTRFVVQRFLNIICYTQPSGD